jgi:hypothetical protein
MLAVPQPWMTALALMDAEAEELEASSRHASLI